MKVLHILSYSPVPPRFGGALRIYYMLKAITQYHETTVVTFGSPEDRMRIHEHFDVPLDNIHVVPHPWVRRHKRLAQCYSLWADRSYFYQGLNSVEMERKIGALLESHDFDAVQTEFPIDWAARCDTDAVKILDAHNVEYEIFQRMSRTATSSFRRWFYHKEYQKLFREELDIISRQDALLVTSERDRSLFDADLPHVSKFVIPNGVDMEYFQPSSEAPEPCSLVFTGMMGYLPNSGGMLYFLDRVLPLVQQEVPEVKVYIVGQSPPKELVRRASDQVVVTGYVDDVRPYVHRASVYVVPLLAGSGTRLKIMEAMAMKKPIVTTSLGCEGIDVKHGDSVLIADDPQTFAQSVIELLRDVRQRRRLVNNGYELVRSSYAWPIVGEKLESVYQTLIPAIKHQNVMVG